MTARKVCRFVRKNENSNWKKRQPNFFLEQKVCAIVGMCIKQCPLLVWGDRQQVNGGITNGFSNYLFHFQTTLFLWLCSWLCHDKMRYNETVSMTKSCVHLTKEQLNLSCMGKTPPPLWSCHQKSGAWFYQSVSLLDFISLGISYAMYECIQIIMIIWSTVQTRDLWEIVGFHL